MGEVVQEDFYCDPIFTLLDPERKRTFSIQGPEQGNCWGLATDAEFNLCHHTQENEEEKIVVVGKLRRNYKVKSSDNSETHYKWSAEFPRELDPVVKAMICSGLLFIVS